MRRSTDGAQAYSRAAPQRGLEETFAAFRVPRPGASGSVFVRSAMVW